MKTKDILASIILLPAKEFTTKTVCKCIKTSSILTDAQEVGQILRPPNKKELEESLKDIEYYFEPQHLYIISNKDKKNGEEFRKLAKIGNWYIDKDNKICLYQDSVPSYHYLNAKLILATTDPSLKLPRLLNSFLLKYTKERGKINEILVEFEEIALGNYYFEYRPKIAFDNTITIKPVIKKENLSPIDWFIYCSNILENKILDSKLSLKDDAEFIDFQEALKKLKK